MPSPLEPIGHDKCNEFPFDWGNTFSKYPHDGVQRVSESAVMRVSGFHAFTTAVDDKARSLMGDRRLDWPKP